MTETDNKEIEVNNGRETHTFRVYRGEGALLLLEQQIRTIFRLPDDQVIFLMDSDGCIQTIVYDTIEEGQNYSICAVRIADGSQDQDLEASGEKEALDESSDEDAKEVEEDVERYLQSLKEDQAHWESVREKLAQTEVSESEHSQVQGPYGSQSTTRVWTPRKKKTKGVKKSDLTQMERNARVQVKLTKLQQKLGLIKGFEVDKDTKDSQKPEMKRALARSTMGSDLDVALEQAKALEISIEERAALESPRRKNQAKAQKPPPEAPMENADKPEGRIQLLLDGIQHYREYAKHYPHAGVPLDPRAIRIQERLIEEEDLRIQRMLHPDEAPPKKKLVDLLTTDQIVQPKHRVGPPRPPPEMKSIPPKPPNIDFLVDAVKEALGISKSKEKAAKATWSSTFADLLNALMAPINRLSATLRQNKKLSYLFLVGVVLPAFLLFGIWIWLTYFDGESERGDGPEKLAGGDG